MKPKEEKMVPCLVKFLDFVSSAKHLTVGETEKKKHNLIVLGQL